MDEALMQEEQMQLERLELEYRQTLELPPEEESALEMPPLELPQEDEEPPQEEEPPLEMPLGEEPSTPGRLPLQLPLLETPPGKRVRLVKKSPRPAAYGVPFAPVGEAGGSMAAESTFLGHTQAEFRGLGKRGMYKAFHNAVVYWLSKKDCSWYLRSDAGVPFAPVIDDDEDESPGVFSDKLKAYLEDVQAPSWAKDEAILAVNANERTAATSNGDKNKFVNNSTALLTWNGDWGLLPGVPFAPGTDLDELCSVLRALPEAQELWRQLRHFCHEVVQQHKVDTWAVSLEVCTQTLEDEGRVRLHGHVFLKREHARLFVRSANSLKFKGSLPFLASTVLGMRVRLGMAMCGMYYLLAPKLGIVFNAGSKAPFTGFPVNGNWIMSMLSSGKMKFEHGRREISRIPNGIARRLADLSVWEAEAKARRLDVLKKARLEALAAEMKPFRQLPEVDAWLQESKAVSMRKKFLVLEGPSKVAKTAFAKSLFGAEATFELNMACGDSFDLRPFNPLVHKLILWDEASPLLVSKQRKLFQCPASEVDLGQSATGLYVYRVWVAEAVMVICTNKWSSVLDSMPSLDAQWIRDNQVHVLVDRSLVA